MAEKTKVKFYLILFLIGFALNLIWEINQMSYFDGKPGSTYAEGVFYCSMASVIDGLAVISIFFLAGSFLNQKRWRFYLLAAFFGAISSIIFENIAFFFKMWSYKENMPVVPLIGVGLLPFLQLILLVPLSILLTNKFNRP